MSKYLVSYHVPHLGGIEPETAHQTIPLQLQDIAIVVKDMFILYLKQIA